VKCEVVGPARSRASQERVYVQYTYIFLILLSAKLGDLGNAGCLCFASRSWRRYAVWWAPLHGPRLVSMEDHWSAGELGRQGRTSKQGESGGLVGEGWPTAALARMRPLPVQLLSNEDSQNSVLSSRFASRQGTMDAECEDRQLNVQRLMEGLERVISALDPKLRRAHSRGH
jgi:hypothetical protein